jgi:hypothetical protein
MKRGGFMALPNDNKEYTYEDYLKFSEDEIVEIIDGKISAISPAPSRIHKVNIYDNLEIDFKLFEL